jgi:hypothetical protein
MKRAKARRSRWGLVALAVLALIILLFSLVGKLIGPSQPSTNTSSNLRSAESNNSTDAVFAAGNAVSVLVTTIFSTTDDGVEATVRSFATPEFAEQYKRALYGYTDANGKKYRPTGLDTAIGLGYESVEKMLEHGKPGFQPLFYKVASYDEANGVAVVYLFGNTTTFEKKGKDKKDEKDFTRTVPSLNIAEMHYIDQHWFYAGSHLLSPGVDSPAFPARYLNLNYDQLLRLWQPFLKGYQRYV